MGNPTQLATGGITLTGAGTGINVASALMGGSASKRQYLYQSHVATMNALIAEQNANYARSVGERENLMFGMKAGQRAGAILTAQGASGIRVDSAGSERVRTSQATVDRMDREQILSNAARRAYGHDVEAVSHRNKAKAYAMAGENAEKAGWIKAATSLVSGATSVADKWYQGKMSGMWGAEPEDNSTNWMAHTPLGA